MGTVERRDLLEDGRGHDNPLQDSCLEIPMDRGAWKAAVHGVAKDRTERLHFPFSLSCIGEGNGNPLHKIYSVLNFVKEKAKRTANVFQTHIIT